MATNKVTTNVIDMSGNTGGLVWAKGTTGSKTNGSCWRPTFKYNRQQTRIQRQRRMEKIF
jgi:hypothetical protein